MLKILFVMYVKEQNFREAHINLRISKEGNTHSNSSILMCGAQLLCQTYMGLDGSSYLWMISGALHGFIYLDINQRSP